MSKIYKGYINIFSISFTELIIMSKYFSIGEVASLYNLSVQTLRHYDKLGLLKPSLVKDSGYRYYSLEQFYKLDLIRFYKKLGLSLLEIKELISNKVTINDVVELLEAQEDEIDNQIKMLQKQKKSIKNKNKYIKSMISKPLGTVFLNKKAKKRIIKVKLEDESLEDAEVSFRKALNEFPKLNDPLTLELAYEINYEEFEEKEIVKYNSYFIVIEDKIDDDRIKVSEIEEGLYASIIYLDYYINNKKYINHLLDFIETENLSIESPLYESCIGSELYNDREKSFMEIFIKVNKNN
ncbi:MerR family transcriptional regulator [Tissierella sp. MSJ-40]|uniref:MerR family transcriptional regulator n=1 Tax=Tissierella simiarum TaxID=2841534 RepID=A0ABS6E5A0_9FIRM|nr:MerR family transcriptional regulator [Tissierella simiarum]MBU5438091.1 MerR family transcriptional regulator [Tissierella simiarum]